MELKAKTATVTGSERVLINVLNLPGNYIEDFPGTKITSYEIDAIRKFNG